MRFEWDTNKAATNLVKHADFGSYLTKLQPDFEPRSFGFKKLSELIKAKPGIFHLEERQVSNSSGKVLCVCAKK